MNERTFTSLVPQGQKQFQEDPPRMDQDIPPYIFLTKLHMPPCHALARLCNTEALSSCLGQEHPLFWRGEIGH